MKFRLNEYRQGVTDEDLLTDVRQVSELIGDCYLSFSLYKSKGKYSEKTFRKRFGSWPNVLTKLGLRNEKTNGEMKRITDEMMLDDLKRVSKLLGSEVVTSTGYKNHGSYANPTINERFGSWSNFITRAGLVDRSIKIITDSYIIAMYFYTTLNGGDHGGQDETCSAGVDGGSKNDVEGPVQIENCASARD